MTNWLPYNTDLLDLTTDIAVAAFFATHEFDEENNSYNPISEGIGYIRCIMHLKF